MAKSNKISSVLDIARYKLGDMPWWVVYRWPEAEDVPQEDGWMLDSLADESSVCSHPKVLFTRGPFKKQMPLLPKLQSEQFSLMTAVLRATLEVEQFTICSIRRCLNTGEFYYGNEDDIWMPESFLMDSKASANREKQRILRQIGKWAKNG